MPINSLEDLVFSILNEIGLAITPDGLVYDQDNMTILKCGGYQIKASVDPRNPAITTDIYLALDPVFDNKLMQMLLGYYLAKQEFEGNIVAPVISDYTEDIPSYNDFDNLRSKRTSLTVISNGITKTSLLYYQKGLKFSDMILRLGGNDFVDLRKFDSLPEESILDVF